MTNKFFIFQELQTWIKPLTVWFRPLQWATHFPWAKQTPSVFTVTFSSVKKGKQNNCKFSLFEVFCVAWNLAAYTNVQPVLFQIKTTTAAESAEKLFQPRTVMYMWYSLGAWVCIFIVFVLWEFCYWRPKHRRRKGLCRFQPKVVWKLCTIPEQTCWDRFIRCYHCVSVMKATLSRTTNVASAHDQAAHREEVARTIFPNIGKTTLFSPKARKRHQKPDNAHWFSFRPDHTSASLDYVANPTYIDDGSEQDFPPNGDLQELLHRQSLEMQDLQQEYESWHDTYTHRVHVTKLRHKQEQNQLLRSMRRHDPMSGDNLNFSNNPSHLDTPYSFYPSGIFTTRSTSRSVATTYRPYPIHKVYPDNFTRGTSMPVENLWCPYIWERHSITLEMQK